MLRLATRGNIFPQPKYQTRQLWEWVNMMFNKPDESRIKEMGPDLACAEWLLRNGGAVKFVGESNQATDYNKLPKSKAPKLLDVIDGTASSISHYGFEHLAGCKHITKIILHQCSYLTDQALKDLSYLDSPLLYLQVSRCLNITDNGLCSIPPIPTLKDLILYDLPAVRNIEGCKLKLEKIMPSCNVKIMY